jgi:putative sterol carrier protein
MAVFANTGELEKVLWTLWEQIKANPGMAKPLIDSKLVVQFRYKDPEYVLTIDCSDGQNMEIISGNGSKKPTVEMSMRADMAHEFWMGKVNIAMALVTGKIVSKGPIAQALTLLPAIKPAFDIYPKIFEQSGNACSSITK